VHAAYAEVIQSAGYDYPFRCGRGTGFSFLEQPQLVVGDKTVLQPGMVLAVDGSVSTDSFRAQVGDSFILTEDGYEAITAHPKTIDDVIVKQG
jgi:Xaa-Pro aminopeptidase